MMRISKTPFYLFNFIKIALSAPVILTEGVDVRYGSLQVLWDISLEVTTGEAVAIIGANGSGKSTLLKTTA